MDHHDKIKKTVIITGYKCNNMCQFCIDENKRDLPNKTTQQIMQEMTNARQRGTTYLEMIGGESTIRPDIILLVSSAKKLGFETISMATNGRMLSYDKFARQIIEAGLTDLIFSIHGHNAKLHDSLTRSKGSFDQLIKGFKNVKKFFPVNIQIVNVTGGGIVGLGKTATARPDGYTLCMFEINTFQAYYVQGMTQYNLVKDFTLINRVGFGEAVIAVGKDSKFKTLTEFIDHAKANPEELSVSVGCGKGCSWHAPVESLMRSVGASSSTCT